MTLRVMLVDDHELVRIGLKTLLSRYPAFEVVAEAAEAAEAVLKVQHYRPDIVVMDIRLGGRSGIDATRDILAQTPETKVVMLTSYPEDDLLFDAITAGASAYVLKHIGGGELINVLDAVGRGESVLDPAVTQRVFHKLRESARQSEDAAFATLTDQELRILALLTDGKTNKEIAGEIFLSERTVRNYVSSILDKLDLSSRAEAAAYAVRHHIESHLPD
ncbi:MAG: response regulator transcription factor [Caldilineaceae bacterium]|nr:response regulator transcription factor [Caldilineaceae bacterium]